MRAPPLPSALASPWSPVLRLALTRLAPAGFALGAAMEGFMFATGFWGVAKRKEHERRVLAHATAAAANGGSGTQQTLVEAHTQEQR